MVWDSLDQLEVNCLKIVLKYTWKYGYKCCHLCTVHRQSLPWLWQKVSTWAKNAIVCYSLFLRQISNKIIDDNEIKIISYFGLEIFIRSTCIAHIKFDVNLIQMQVTS